MCEISIFKKCETTLPHRVVVSIHWDSSGRLLAHSTFSVHLAVVVYSSPTLFARSWDRKRSNTRYLPPSRSPPHSSEGEGHVEQCTVGGGNSSPLQCSCLGNPTDRGAWGTAVHGAARVRHDRATKPPPQSRYSDRYLHSRKAYENKTDSTYWYVFFYSLL